MAKKKADDVLIIELPPPDSPPQDEGIPPWMATFADMVTLLLCFFVLLLSFTSQDVANFEKLKGAMQKAFGVQLENSEATEIPYADLSKEYENIRETEEEVKQLATSLQAFVEDENLKQEASVRSDSSGITLRVSNTAMFQPGSVTLDPRAMTVLVEVVQVLMSSDFKLTVRGHTDGENLGPDLLDRNWELSAVRAATCLRFILEHSPVSPDRLRAVGYAGSAPLVPSNSEENRALNRRVEFFFQAPRMANW